jgi:hypothetical protein
MIDMTIYFINLFTFDTKMYSWNTNEYMVFEKISPVIRTSGNSSQN